MTGHLVMSYHPLGSRLRLMLGSMKVFLHFGFSGQGRATWFLPRGLISDGSGGANLLLWLLLKTFLGESSVLNVFVWSVAISAPGSPFLVSGFESSDSVQFNSSFFSKVLIEDSNGLCEFNSVLLSFFGFKVEAVVEIVESSAQVWPFGTRCNLNCAHFSCRLHAIIPEAHMNCSRRDCLQLEASRTVPTIHYLLKSALFSRQPPTGPYLGPCQHWRLQLLE